MKVHVHERPDCRVYWGSHGCTLERGHEGTHKCTCCECKVHAERAEDGCVGAWPYYGKSTKFYGEDSDVGNVGNVGI